MPINLSRRQTLVGLAAAPLLHYGANASAQVEMFGHGVASGDPDQESFVIWTRVKPSDGAVPVNWAVATNRDFTNTVASGKLETGPERDFTVKTVVAGLAPGQTYFYRFEVDGQFSDVGRALTLPEGSLSSLGFAIASCSNYPFGYFNAYDAIAKDTNVSFVLHLGDYIYEYGIDGYGGETGINIGRSHAPRTETISLADYRVRHAQYKSDPGSKAMHAAHPLIAIWDDHESTNNPWTGGAQNHQPDTEGDWRTRRDVSLQAYYEWMPVRDPSATQSRAERWRSMSFGDLATLVTLETRHTARSLQIDYADHLPNLKSAKDVARFRRDVLGNPKREMISEKMAVTLREGLRDSVAKGQPWRLIGNQIPMARTNVPDLTEVEMSRNPDGYDPVAEERQQMIRLGQLGLPFYLDTWDGYPAARERFYELCADTGASDLLVLTGDSHSFWANQLFSAKGRPMGLELGTAGITSPGDFESLPPENAKLMDKMIADTNKEVVWTDGRHRGYVRVALSRDRARADYVTVDTILMPEYSARVLKSFEIIQKGDSLAYAT